MSDLIVGFKYVTFGRIRVSVIVVSCWLKIKVDNQRGMRVDRRTKECNELKDRSTKPSGGDSCR